MTTQEPTNEQADELDQEIIRIYLNNTIAAAIYAESRHRGLDEITTLKATVIALDEGYNRMFQNVVRIMRESPVHLLAEPQT